MAYLSGYYPKAIDEYVNYKKWQEEWQMSEPDEKEEENWIWFEGDYTEYEVRESIKQSLEEVER